MTISKSSEQHIPTHSKSHCTCMLVVYMCVSVCMCGVCTHIHMYIWKVTLREVAMYLCVRVVYMCGVYTYTHVWKVIYS